MKKLSRTLAMLGVLGAGAIPVSSFAVDGTITFTGSVVTSTCSINGGTPDQTIPLPPVSSDKFQVLGDTAGTTPVNITLAGCGNSFTGARAGWEPDATHVDTSNDPTRGMLKNVALPATAAKNVFVQLLNSNNLQPISALDNNNNPYTDFTSGAATLKYFAQYFAGGPVEAGDVNAAIRFSINYQ